MTSLLWTSYASPVTVLSTELNALAASSANTLSTLGAAFQNLTELLYCDIEFAAGGTFSPVAGGAVEVWFLRSIDGGLTYEDGSASLAPARPPDARIAVRGGTSITPRSMAPGASLPPGFYKAIARNGTKTALPATGNIIRIAAYSMAG